MSEGDMCIQLGYVCVVLISCYPYALSHLLCLDECCSVSLLVSTSFAAAKLHHIAGQFLLPTGEHSRSCLASTCLWYLLSPSFSFVSSPPFVGNPWPDFRRFEMMTLARLPFRLGLGRVMDATGYLQDS